MDYASLIAEKGFFIDRSFFTNEEVQLIMLDLHQQRKDHKFRLANVGKANQGQIDVRRDSTMWFDLESLTPAQRIVVNKITVLRDLLNRELFLSLNDFEAHYAIYPPGGYYQKHLDRFENDNSRVISLVCYLNTDWQSSFGGQLALYPNGIEPNGIQTLVEPLAGTLVGFRSDSIEHEVLAAHKERFSIAAWIKSRRVG